MIEEGRDQSIGQDRAPSHVGEGHVGMKPKRPVVSDALETPDAWQCGRLDMPENHSLLRQKPGVKMTYSTSELAEWDYV